MSQNPYQPPNSPNPFADQMLGHSNDPRAVEEAAKRMLRDKHDKTTSWQLLITGIIGCFSPILSVYGIIFLLRRSYSFPTKTLAVIGTVLHCLWTLLLIASVALSIAAGPR